MLSGNIAGCLLFSGRVEGCRLLLAGSKACEEWLCPVSNGSMYGREEAAEAVAASVAMKRAMNEYLVCFAAFG